MSSGGRWAACDAEDIAASQVGRSQPRQAWRFDETERDSEDLNCSIRKRIPALGVHTPGDQPEQVSLARALLENHFAFFESDP